MGRRTSEAEFRRLWLDTSISTEEIGRHLDISQQAVCCRAKARGLPPRGANRATQWAITGERAEQLRAMWEAGVPSGEMLAYFGVTKETLIGTAARLGLPRRGRQRRPTTTLTAYFTGEGMCPLRLDGRRRRREPALVRELWEAGLAYADMAALMGVSTAAVQQFCRRRGWVRSMNHRPKLTLAQWREQQFAARLAEVAARETRLERDARMGIRRAA